MILIDSLFSDFLVPELFFRLLDIDFLLIGLVMFSSKLPRLPSKASCSMSCLGDNSFSYGSLGFLILTLGLDCLNFYLMLDLFYLLS